MGMKHLSPQDESKYFLLALIPHRTIHNKWCYSIYCGALDVFSLAASQQSFYCGHTFKTHFIAISPSTHPVWRVRKLSLILQTAHTTSSTFQNMSFMVVPSIYSVLYLQHMRFIIDDHYRWSHRQLIKGGGAFKGYLPSLLVSSTRSGWYVKNMPFIIVHWPYIEGLLSLTFNNFKVVCIVWKHAFFCSHYLHAAAYAA